MEKKLILPESWWPQGVSWRMPWVYCSRGPSRFTPQLRSEISEVPDVRFLWLCTSAQGRGCALHPFWRKLSSRPHSGFGWWAQTRSGCGGQRGHPAAPPGRALWHSHTLQGNAALARCSCWATWSAVAQDSSGREEEEHGSKFLWILVVRRELLGKSDPSWCRRVLRALCSCVVSAPSLTPGPQTAHHSCPHISLQHSYWSGEYIQRVGI